MIFYRSPTQNRDIGRGLARTLSTGSLIAYPVGAFILEFGDGLGSTLLGFGLICVALACVFAMAGSTIQRIVGEEAGKLDEYELKLRFRAIQAAYAAMTSIVLILIIYAAIASDNGWWAPTSYDEFNGLFWGVFLYATMLPSAFLAWQIDPADAAPEA